MPFTNPVVAYGDPLGYSYCVPCAHVLGKVDPPGYDAGNSAVQDLGGCEGCGTDLAALFDPAHLVPVSSFDSPRPEAEPR